MGKKFFIGLASFSLMGLLVVGGFFFWLLSRPAPLQSWVQQQTGLMVQAKSFEWDSIFPILRFQAHQVAFESQQQPVASVGQLSVGLNLPQLLLGKIILETVVLEQFQLEVGFSEEGNLHFGQWMLPTVSQEGGILSGFTFRVNHWQVVQGELDLHLPDHWEMPTLQFSHIFAHGKLQKGEVRLQARLDWGGKVAKFAGEFEKIQEHWQGGYQISQIPLHHFTIPAAPQVFPAMPLEGNLDLQGTLQESPTHWKSQAAWQVSQGKIKSPYFPRGHMPLLALAGNLQFALDLEQGAHLKIDLQQAEIPPGNLQGEVRFDLPFEAPPLMQVDVEAARWQVNASKPYIFGFMPPLASDWIEAHIHDGIIEQAHFDLRWKMDFDYADVNEVLHLNLQSELTGVQVEPFEKIPPVTEIHAHLHLGLWGLSVEVEEGRFPGSRLEGGVFSMGYGAPVRTPFQLEVYGEIETAETWPLILSLWEEKVPWLRDLSFQGKAHVKFLLEDDNLLDDAPLSMELQGLPRQVDVQWKTNQQTYRVQAVQGQFLANLDELAWQDLAFTHASLQGKSAGTFSFVSPAPLKVDVHLDSLETWLPVQAKGHPSWPPQSLSADLKLRQSFREGLPLLWQLEVTTTDDQQQNLTLQAQWENNQWKLPKITGKLGTLKLEGFLDWPAQEGALQVESQVSEALNVQLNWSQAAATFKAQAAELAWQDWLHWELPQEVWALFPAKDSQAGLLEIPLKKLQGTLAVKNFSLPGNPPTRLETQFFFEKSPTKNNLFLKKWVLGSQQGQAHVQYQDEKLAIQIQRARLDPHFWLNFFQNTGAAGNAEPSNFSGIRHIQVDLQEADWHFSPSFVPQIALQTAIDLPHPAQNQPLAWTMQVQQFDGELPQLQAKLAYEKAVLKLQMQGHQIQLEPWLEAMNPNAPSTWQAQPPTGLKQIQFDAQFESLQVFEQEIAQVSFQSTLDFPTTEDAPFRWEVQNFQSTAGFVLPGQPDAFPNMPFSATFQLAGKGKFHPPTPDHPGQGSGQFHWKMNHGRLQNENFPQQQMLVQMAGTGKFDLRPQGTLLRVHLTEAQMPFGTLAGQADIVVSAKERSGFSLRLEGGNGSLAETKPYLLGILPAVARPWARSHLSGGKIEDAHLNFRGVFAPDFSAVADVEQFDLRASFTGVEVRLLENDVAIENVGGQLHWGLEGGRLQIEQERFLKAGLPLAEQNSGENPAARSSFQEKSPHDKKATHAIEALQGTVWFNAEGLAWEGLRFKSGLLEVQGEGRFPFGEEAPKMWFRLRHLEHFLPIYEGFPPENSHAFAQWFPQKLSAVVEVAQIQKTDGIRKWHAHVVTTDERNQHLEVDVAWEGTTWRIQKIEGQLGQIATTTRPNPTENLLELKISPFQHQPIHVQFQWEDRQGRLALQTPALRWQDWLGWKMPAGFKNWGAAASDLPSVSLEAHLAIEALELPGSPSAPFQTKFFFQQKKEGFLFVFHELMFDEQKAQGELYVLQDQISLKVRSERFQVQSWWNLLQGWRESPLGNGAQPAIAALHLDFQTQHLVFSETFQPPLSLNMSLHFPQSSEEAISLKLHDFEFFGTEGEGTFLLAREGKLDLRLNHTHFEPFLRDVFQLSAVPWLRTGLQSEASGFWESLDFLLEVPQQEIRMAGRATLAAPNFQIDFQQLKWEEQTGRLFVEQTDTEFNILGSFPYLDLERWSELRSDVQKMLEEAKAAKSHQHPQPKEEFTLTLPTKNWQVDVTVGEMKLRKTSLKEFVFQGRWGRKEIVVPKFVWKQNEKQAFSLAGNITPQGDASPIWRGAFSVEIAELGEVIELLFGTNSSIARQYPIRGGQSHLQADVELLPAGTDRWKPQAQLLFQSKEGIVARQESLTFLLATFSLQSYAKAAQGKLSGFEGKGLIYNSIESEMQLDGGRLEVKNFVFDSPALRFVASGILDYETDEQDLLICLQPFETLDSILRNIPLVNLLLTSRRGSFLEGCYKSSGAIEASSTIPLPQTILPGRLRDLLIPGFSG